MSKVILMIDDDRSERGLFEEAIKKVGSDITCYLAEGGKEALEIMSNKDNILPKVIFLDINMPEMSGWVLLKNLKENETYKDIPVIMYSTSSYQRDIDMAMQFGAVSFCVKPENFKILIKIVDFISNNLDGDLPNAIRQNNEGIDNFKGGTKAV